MFKNAIKRIVSGVMATSIVISAFSLCSYVSAAEFSAANITKGGYDFYALSSTDNSYTYNETLGGTGKTKQIEVNFSGHGSSRDKIVNYYNTNGTPADFAHVRFFVSSQNSTPAGEDDLYGVGYRFSQYNKKTASFRFNVNRDGVSLWGGESDNTGYVVGESAIQSSVSAPKYNKFDYIQDCNNGVVYLIIDDVLVAYGTDGARDGKFYGFDISKSETYWDAGDVFVAKFEGEEPEHTIYKSTEEYPVTIEDVLKNAGIPMDSVIAHKKKINECVDYITENISFVHERNEPFMVSGPGLLVPVEEANYTKHYDVIIDRDAADLKALKSNWGNNDTPANTAGAHIQVNFQVEERGTYNIWIRTLGLTNREDSFFYAYANNDYKQKAMTRGKYYWYRIHGQIFEPGETYTVRIRSREAGGIIDSVLVTRVPGHVPEGRYGELPDSLPSKVELLDTEEYPDTKVTPPVGEHPRVMFRKEDIPRIIENFNAPDNKAVRDMYNYHLEDEIEMDLTSYSAGNLTRIEIHALDYALFGNKENGRLAIEGMLSMFDNVSFSNSGLLYREAGHFVHTAGKVYDWCYDLLTQAEKDKLLLSSVINAGSMENGWPPEKQHGFTGHGAEAQLLRDLLTLAIAVYDERPDLWDFIGGRYYDQYVPSRNEFDTGLLQGSDYGIYREMWSAWSYVLIRGMGGEVPIDLDNYYESSLWPIYFRRPDGQMMRDGDTSLGDKNAIWDYWETYPQYFLLVSSLTKNPYVKYEFARLAKGFDDYTGSNDYCSTADAVILLDANVKAADSFEGLPLSKYFTSGIGEVIARTGWDDGVGSPAVVAQMKVQEHQVNGHMHLDAGNFQLYYKGILASNSGVYQGANNSTSGDGATAYGSEHFNQYQTKSIAHNCMLVYDPSEGDGSSSRATINDGGQRSVNGGSETSYTGINKNREDYNVGEVQGMEIDPKNPQKPMYSYLKGDITNAYSNKLTDYKRSFMFLNLDNEDVPAALIVYDKIDSANAGFKKTWLVHTLEEPQIDGNQTVAGRTYQSPVKAYGYNGKMTMDTLLPKSANIEKIGGEETGWYTVNGKNYDGYAFKSETDEGETWRVEVSPSTGNTADHFLNIMQVSDADKENYLPTELIKTELFYGVTISDRAVLFSKDAKRVDTNFEISINGSGDYQYTVCDVASGVYEVTAGGKTQTVNVTQEGGVLAFTAPAGKVSVIKTDAASEPAKKAEINSPQATDKVNFRIDDVFIYSKDKPYIKDGTTVADATMLVEQYGVKSLTENGSFRMWNKNFSIEFAEGSQTALANGENISLPIAPWYENGNLMVPVRQTTEALGGSIEWDPSANTVYAVAPPRDLSLPEGYIKVESVIPDDGAVDDENVCENLIDEDQDTIWAAQGVGRYVTLVFNGEKTVEAVEIMFNPNAGRDARFDIEVSSDGASYKKIYTGTGDGSVESGCWERYEFGSSQKAKYVRFVANGSNISTWNAVKEIRVQGK